MKYSIFGTTMPIEIFSAINGFLACKNITISLVISDFFDDLSLTREIYKV